ncbi:hypothetical protein IW261DRAFT_1624952 [Armillaria novae-zelandiae]|uniref:Uncharacterized protein n=1 Tax=Armillaria novae-zelandiae TaxID=153914 RepID=A0AA39UHZ1_9AGAR|nr:hypothetical protein IW261DRAFT_1624952 [Armillaria novae-zelandiae]
MAALPTLLVNSIRLNVIQDMVLLVGLERVPANCSPSLPLSAGPQPLVEEVSAAATTKWQGAVAFHLKTERRIVKYHRTQSNVKEREEYKTPVVNLYGFMPFFFLACGYTIREQGVTLESKDAREYPTGNLFVWRTVRSVAACAMKVYYVAFLHLLGADWTLGGRSKDEKMQVKDQDYTYGNNALLFHWLISQNTMHSDTNLIQSMPQGMGRCYHIEDENGYRIILFKLKRLPGQLPIGTCDTFWAYHIEVGNHQENYYNDTLKYPVELKTRLPSQHTAKSKLATIFIPTSYSESSSPGAVRKKSEAPSVILTTASTRNQSSTLLIKAESPSPLAED